MNLARFQLDEADVLAVIEGTPLAPDREARVRHAMRVDAEIGRGVAAMQADRGALLALAEIAAPADLLQRVGAQLERDDVLGLSEPDAPFQLPVSTVQPRKQSALIAVIASPWSKRLAMAAGVAIVAGATVMLARPLLNRPAKPSSITPDLARDTSPRPVDPPTKGPSPVAVPDRLAVGTPTPTSPDKGAGTPATPDVPPSPVVASIEQPEIGIEEALRLAREGRLAVRIATRDAEHAVARLETLRGRRTISLGVERLNTEQGAVLAAALSRDYDRIVAQITAPSPTPGAPTAPTTVAGDKSKSEPARVERPAHAPPVIIPAAPQYAAASFTAQVPLDEASLLSLLRAVATGDSAARFIMLDRPVQPALPLDPASVLWWSGPAAAFAPRAQVPIAVQVSP